MGLFIGYRHSIADAFGNAIGNSIVAGIQRSETEKNNRNRYIEETGAKIVGNTQRMQNARDALFYEDVNRTTETSLNDSTSRMLWAINRNNVIDAQEAYAKEEAANLARRDRIVTSTNAYSDLTQANIQSVSYQHELNKYNRALNAQDYGEQLSARYQRGNQIAADEFGKFNPVQNDLLAGIDVEANIAWGQQRRDAFNQFYNNLNSIERRAFDTAVWANEQVIDFGKGVANTALLTYQVGDMLLDGADIRGAVAFKNKQSKIEVKGFFGSDIAGVSYKHNNVTELKDLPPGTKRNVTQRFIFDTWGSEDWNFRTDYIQEIDLMERDFDIPQLSRLGIEQSAAYGIRRNLTTLDNRASLNIKFELPKSVQKYTFDWTPSFSIELRGR